MTVALHGRVRPAVRTGARAATRESPIMTNIGARCKPAARAANR
ncbi:hypothetical protein BURMUCGD2M_2025 [Burkholderia multivorans CGD2M]|uniref:Uncharacterized protein n=1 Tax=Burkholderia multivorans CGD2 TaxID=513052 RepID=B9BM70_9BURK|nr:hypothetical protein BURMUCGD2_1939 [Burkholderia multivorans CGD2]EEE14332.1 hypothetical protein BURMUCGD2M_2025 [Burkholderia multivorans CGD2M]